MKQCVFVCTFHDFLWDPIGQVVLGLGIFELLSCSSYKVLSLEGVYLANFRDIPKSESDDKGKKTQNDETNKEATAPPRYTNPYRIV